MASAEGRRAHTAYREQRALMLDPEAKHRVLASLLRQHRDDRVIIFTNDNRTAYAIATAHLLPVITHQTGVKERQFILSAFHAGEVRAVVTSRVLNEGVDVPAARVAIIVSGTGTVREHVQRLGRILRRAEGKEALLYEIVTANTAEVGLSARRRDHAAYRDGE